MSGYFARDGEPIGSTEWSALFESARNSAQTGCDYRHVGRDTVNDSLGGEHYVSTVWLGLDHSLGPPDLPLIFETMAFCHDHVCALDKCLWRYSTEAGAAEGHASVVALIVRSSAKRGPAQSGT